MQYNYINCNFLVFTYNNDIALQTLAVTALQSLYIALNKPPHLKGWKLGEGDPCQESWTGVSCFGSSVIYL